MIEILAFIFVVFYAWLSSFLLHEWFHIKSQGILMHGSIKVTGVGFTATPDNTYDLRYMRFAGGFYSGIVNLILGIIFWLNDLWYLYVPFITFGMINLIYGFWEMKYGGEGRWKIYAGTTLGMIAFWVIYWFFELGGILNG